MAVNLEQELRTAQRKLREAHDEIERLREHYDKHLDDRIEWQAEIERLTVDFRGAANKNQELMASNKSHHAEIKRLRAALERIHELIPEGDQSYQMYKIAREALL